MLVVKRNHIFNNGEDLYQPTFSYGRIKNNENGIYLEVYKDMHLTDWKSLSVPLSNERLYTLLSLADVNHCTINKTIIVLEDTDTGLAEPYFLDENKLKTAIKNSVLNYEHIQLGEEIRFLKLFISNRTYHRIMPDFIMRNSTFYWGGVDIDNQYNVPCVNLISFNQRTNNLEGFRVPLSSIHKDIIFKCPGISEEETIQIVNQIQ